jgi:hypothetical protein
MCVCADNLNTRHRNAQQAGRASIELYTLIYFYGKEVTADARVLQVRGSVSSTAGGRRIASYVLLALKPHNSMHSLVGTPLVIGHTLWFGWLVAPTILFSTSHSGWA